VRRAARPLARALLRDDALKVHDARRVAGLDFLLLRVEDGSVLASSLGE
jgi:hypothetical protein